MSKQTKNKEKSALSELMRYAGNCKYLTYASWVLSAASAVIALLPFVCIFRIIQEIIAVAPDFSQAVNLVHNGVWAVIFAGVHAVVFLRADVLAFIRISRGGQYSQDADGTYHQAADWLCR